MTCPQTECALRSPQITSRARVGVRVGARPVRDRPGAGGAGPQDRCTQRHARQARPEQLRNNWVTTLVYVIPPAARGVGLVRVARRRPCSGWVPGRQWAATRGSVLRLYGLSRWHAVALPEVAVLYRGGTAMWSAAVFATALPPPSTPARNSPVLSKNATSG